MLAKLQKEIPRGPGWLYEPKWDGFRAIVFRDGARMQVDSRNGQPLDRYFPELLEILAAALPERCVADGEIVVAVEDGLEFESLQMRIHPADSRVRLLSKQIPSSFIAFDLLALDEDLRGRPLGERRALLREEVSAHPSFLVTPQTDDPEVALSWFDRFEGAGLDGVVAKRSDQRYVEGERVMVKVKHQRTADCVVGGYRLSKDGRGIGSLLLGLYDEHGVFHHLGHTSSFKAGERREILRMLQPLVISDDSDESFGGGRTPGTPSRWSSGKEAAWTRLQPKLVCEVAFDHLQGDRFRHGTTFLRWRHDKDPRECTYDQFEGPEKFTISEIRKLSAKVSG